MRIVLRFMARRDMAAGPLPMIEKLSCGQFNDNLQANTDAALTTANFGGF
jgi:hypothetical protein